MKNQEGKDTVTEIEIDVCESIEGKYLKMIFSKYKGHEMSLVL